MGRDLSRVTLTCRLTRDPELRHTPSGTAVCGLRVAWTTRTKSGEEWGDKSNFIDVTVWGNQGESCAQYLAKGRRIAVDGRLEYREWEGQDGSKRSTHEIVADSVVYLDSRGDQDEAGFAYAGAGQRSDETPDFVPTAPPGGHPDDDIPF
jgi:single-strand DNA-binding protein